MSSEVRAYIRHIRAARICAAGARHWFAQQGWSWQDFLREGRPAADFEATGDHFAAQVAELARQEAANGSR
jgi:hypothetical protein